MNAGQYEGIMGMLEKILDRMPPSPLEVTGLDQDERECILTPAEEVSEPAGELDHVFVFDSLRPGRCGFGVRGGLCSAARSAHSPLAARRQALLDLFWNSDADHGQLVEKALTVRMTMSMVECVNEILESSDFGMQDHRTAQSITLAVLKAAGFKVEQ